MTIFDEERKKADAWARQRRAQLDYADPWISMTEPAVRYAFAFHPRSWYNYFGNHLDLNVMISGDQKLSDYSNIIEEVSRCFNRFGVKYTVATIQDPHMQEILYKWRHTESQVLMFSLTFHLNGACKFLRRETGEIKVKEYSYTLDCGGDLP